MRALVILLALTTAAAAEPVVVAVDGADIYVDLGARDGVGAGAELELLHEVVVRDPRTGATLRDRFALGTIRVVKSGDKVSVARADEVLQKRVLAGDRVNLVSEKQQFIDPWAERVAASQPAAPDPIPPRPQHPIDHAELARQAFAETLGKPLEVRVTRWLELLRTDPQTPYTAAIQREVATLRAHIQARDEALAKARSETTSDRAPRIARLAALLGSRTGVLAIGALATAEPNKPITMAFLVREPAQIAKAWLFVRAPDERGFKRIELVADGDAYLRATIDAATVRAPRVQWYVEVQAPDADRPEPALGSQAAPYAIAIERDVVEAPIEPNRSHIDAHVDYVDFDGGFADGFDQYYQAEIDFTYRFLAPVYAARLGFGTLDGKGGPKDIIDADETDRCVDTRGVYRCKQVNFSYVYAELEYRIRPNVAVMLRPQAGILTTDVMQGSARNRCAGAANLDGCEFFTGFGGRVRLRLGEETSTNLVLGAGFTDGVGTLLEAAYQWRPTPVVPVQLSIHVTDQPIAENLGVRLIGDVGYRRLAWVYPSVRFSYQARDIDHAGFSAGAAMNFDW